MQLLFWGNKHPFCFGRLRCVERCEKPNRQAGFSRLFSSPCRHKRLGSDQQITSIAKPLRKNVVAIIVLQSVGQNQKIILWSLRRRALFWRVQGTDSWTGKNKNFPIRYCPLLSLRNQFFLLVYTACLNRMRNNKLSTRSYITNQSPGPGTDHEYWFAFFFSLATAAPWPVINVLSLFKRPLCSHFNCSADRDSRIFCAASTALFTTVKTLSTAALNSPNLQLHSSFAALLKVTKLIKSFGIDCD